MGKKRVAIKRAEERLKKEVKKKLPKKVKECRLYISSSFNNTILTLTDLQGNVLFWTSAGYLGFKGTKKGTPFAASKSAEVMAEVINENNIEGVQVLIKGVGAGRESALRSLAVRGVNIVSIKDITPIPHNGCRPPKMRRV